MEQLQKENPNDDFEILDTDGKPVEIDDFTNADLRMTQIKAKTKAAAALEYKESIKKILRNCV